jgi:prolyl-tRNA editing enzyme YbaK/EbsC (Cys-tRNA(Pro) deacylase)
MSAENFRTEKGETEVALDLKTGRKKDENRVVIYPSDDVMGILTKRAERAGTTPNLYVKTLVEEALRRDDDGILTALNLLAEKLSENSEAITNLRADIGSDLQQIANALEELLDEREAG